MNPAIWRTRRFLRALAQRRRRPFERVAVVCARRAESALNAGYTVAGPTARPGHPVRGEAARWLDCERAHHERGLAAFWRAFHAEPDKEAWVQRAWKSTLFVWAYRNTIWHMSSLVRDGGARLARIPLQVAARDAQRGNDAKV